MLLSKKKKPCQVKTKRGDFVFADTWLKNEEPPFYKGGSSTRYCRVGESSGIYAFTPDISSDTSLFSISTNPPSTESVKV
ncbi:MAG TPA: hypothetical protein PLW66_02545, partial [Saprospiraceae bacterium]|nr:hypothetical protein [Saprospiraceae bacterium]